MQLNCIGQILLQKGTFPTMKGKNSSHIWIDTVVEGRPELPQENEIVCVQQQQQQKRTDILQWLKA